MKNRKLLWNLVCAGVLSAALLGGCGKKDTSEERICLDAMKESLEAYGFSAEKIDAMLKPETTMESIRQELGIDDKRISLAKLVEKLGIENPRAHRALADAITTARVYLKLKEMDGGEATTVDDILGDLDDW